LRRYTLAKLIARRATTACAARTFGKVDYLDNQLSLVTL